MAKGIEFNVVEAIKKLPKEFWVKVPTWNERHRSEFLKDYEYGYGGKPRREFKPPAYAEFPEYAELYDKYLGMNPEHMYQMNRKGKPTQDWIECILPDDYKLRIHLNYGREHAVLLPSSTEWVSRRNITWQESSKLHKAEKKLASLWNRLRKKYRREAGKELGVEEAAIKKEALRRKKIDEYKKECVAHIDEYIDALQTYKRQIENEEVTRAETSVIFGMGNHMTSLGASFRDALGKKQ